MAALKYVDDKNKEELIRYCNNKLKEHEEYIKEYGVDMPEIENFTLKVNK